jgi:hypothetical protein
MRMIGGTYSASHVRAPQLAQMGIVALSKSNGTSAWTLCHDSVLQMSDAEDWRFACLVEHTSELMRLWAYGRRSGHRHCAEQDR